MGKRLRRRAAGQPPRRVMDVVPAEERRSAFGGASVNVLWSVTNHQLARRPADIFNLRHKLAARRAYVAADESRDRGTKVQLFGTQTCQG